LIIDLHVHSRYTRGCDLDPGLIVRRAKDAGLDGVCFTELNSLDAAADLHALGKNSPVKVFVGMELTTDRGHYLCYFPDPEAVADPVQMWGSNAERAWPARETVDAVRKLGGVVVAAHPYDRETPVAAGDFVFGLKELAGIEAYNARRKVHVNNLATEAAESLRLPSIGCSDTRLDIAELGKAATVFPMAIENEAELCAALQKGRFWPLLFGAPPPGLSSGAAGADRGKSAGGGAQRRDRDHRGGGRGQGQGHGKRRRER
jgi:predicted metal-dependent phosphoesterase TrpH